MSTANAHVRRVRALDRAPSPFWVWAASVAYAFATISPIFFYYFFRANDVPSGEYWAVATPLAPYIGVGLLYYASAAACTYLLIRRSAHAVWPALVVAVWVALQQVAELAGHPPGAPYGPGISGWLPVLWFALLALCVRWLRGSGALR